MSDNEILKVKDLSILYKTDLETVYAVNHVSFTLNKGQTLGLVGETGAGKTTTALGIMSLLPKRTARVTSGEILFEGQDLLKMSEKELLGIRGQKISMIFQDPMTALNPVLTVGDQIGETVRLHNTKNLSREEIEKKVEDTLELVGIPKERKNEYPYQFSGGMRQRVVIAMALICDPRMLIADEPTTALDVTIQAQVLSMICDLQRKYGTSMIMITHDLGVVAETCDTVGVVYAGEIVEYGQLADIFAGEDHHPYTEGLRRAVSMRRISAAAKSRRCGRRTDIRSAAILRESGRRQSMSDRLNENSESIMQVRNLKKYFKINRGYLHAVDDVTFDIPRGKTLGVVGESGCGKSTLGRTVLRLNEPTGGEILFHGQDLVKADKREMKQIRPRMQMIFQDPYSSLNGRMTTAQLIAEPLIVNKVCRSRSEIDERVDDMMDTVGLAKRLVMAYPHELDGGRR